MKQIATQCFESDCGKSKIYVENDMPLGVFHDFLMSIKGTMVDRMVEAQKAEEKQAEEMKKQEECKSGCSQE